MSRGVNVSTHRHFQKFTSGELRGIAAGMYFQDTWKVVNCLSCLCWSEKEGRAHLMELQLHKAKPKWDFKAMPSYISEVAGGGSWWWWGGDVFWKVKHKL